MKILNNHALSNQTSEHFSILKQIVEYYEMQLLAKTILESQNSEQSTAISQMSIKDEYARIVEQSTEFSLENIYDSLYENNDKNELKNLLYKITDKTTFRIRKVRILSSRYYPFHNNIDCS